MAPRTYKNPGVCVALLRGVNVGGKGMVSMQALKKLFEKLGLRDVRTYINSGNIIFRTSKTDMRALAKTLENTIEKAAGIKSKVFLRSFSEMKKLNKALPATWANNEQTKCDILFLADEIKKPGIVKLLPWSPALEEVLYLPGAAGWKIPRKKITKSRMLKLVGTPLYKQMTIRNPNTVRKIFALMQEM